MSNFISIVVPALNEEKYLPLCLASLRNQDYQGKYEIIVVDNGSTDGTSRVALDHGVKVITCERKGVAYARQAGAEAASGNIIVQVDADTVYPSNWLSRIDKHFTRHPKSAGLAGTYIYLNPPFWANIEYFLRYLANILSVIFIGNASYISGANFAFRREAFEKAKGYSVNSLYPDQWGIAHRLSKFGRIYYDGSLYVRTSARRIDKPAYRVFLDVIINASRIFTHFIKFLYKLFKNSGMKSVRTLKPLKLGIIILLSVIIALIAYGYYAPTAQVFGKVYDMSRTKQKVIALTFDDGPNEPYTSQILDILQSYNINATFFLIGENVELYPETAKRIVADGNVVGNHTYHHEANHALTEEGDSDIALAEKVIYNITGVKPHLYRPPHGKKSPWEIDTLRDDGMVEVTWSDTANDQHTIAYYGKPTPEKYAAEIVNRAKPGRIILMHDGFGTLHDCSKADQSLTVQALPIVISELQKQGYRFVTVPELLGINAYNN